MRWKTPGIGRRAAVLVFAASVALVLGSLGAWAQSGSALVTPVPQGPQRQIVAYFGHTYLPGWLPAGYVFAQWHSQPGSATVYGESLLIDFGRHGDKVQWTVGDASDPSGYSGDACSSHPYGAQFIRVGTRRIVFQSGNHGADATLCIRGAGGVTAISVWNGHSLSPRVQAQIAASARLVG
jgi:hypothetical protein